MLTYTPPESRAPVQAREHPWLLLLLVFAWLWPGVFSHDLWNPAEPQVYAAVENFIRGGNAWMPAVLGEPYFDVSPVYVWVAAFFQMPCRLGRPMFIRPAVLPRCCLPPSASPAAAWRAIVS